MSAQLSSHSSSLLVLGERVYDIDSCNPLGR